MKKFFATTMILFFSVLLVAGTSWAVPIIEFDDIVAANQFGTITYDGSSSGVAVGTNIYFDQVTGTGTPSNSGKSYSISNGSLSFTTGQNTIMGPNYWEFGAGGTFKLIGGISELSISNGTTLLEGTFDLATVSAVVGIGLTFNAFGFDTKDSDLLAAYGIYDMSGWKFVNTEISLDEFTIGADGSFSGKVDNADINNKAVPEPSTLLLLGFGLFGTAIFGRKKLLEN